MIFEFIAFLSYVLLTLALLSFSLFLPLIPLQRCSQGARIAPRTPHGKIHGLLSMVSAASRICDFLAFYLSYLLLTLTSCFFVHSSLLARCSVALRCIGSHGCTRNANNAVPSYRSVETRIFQFSPQKYCNYLTHLLFFSVRSTPSSPQYQARATIRPLNATVARQTRIVLRKRQRFYFFSFCFLPLCHRLTLPSRSLSKISIKATPKKEKNSPELTLYNGKITRQPLHLLLLLLASNRTTELLRNIHIAI